MTGIEALADQLTRLLDRSFEGDLARDRGALIDAVKGTKDERAFLAWHRERIATGGVAMLIGLAEADPKVAAGARAYLARVDLKRLTLVASAAGAKTHPPIYGIAAIDAKRICVIDERAATLRDASTLAVIATVPHADGIVTNRVQMAVSRDHVAWADGGKLAIVDAKTAKHVAGWARPEIESADDGDYEDQAIIDAIAFDGATLAVAMDDRSTFAVTLGGAVVASRKRPTSRDPSTETDWRTDSDVLAVVTLASGDIVVASTPDRLELVRRQGKVTPKPALDRETFEALAIVQRAVIKSTKKGASLVSDSGGWPPVALDRRTLTGMALDGIWLQRSSWVAVSAAGVHLAKADLTGACFAQANLSNADLRGAKLAGVSFEDADLTNADLRDADLTNASLEKARLHGARIAGARFAGLRVAGAQLDANGEVITVLGDAEDRGVDIDGLGGVAQAFRPGLDATHDRARAVNLIKTAVATGSPLAQETALNEAKALVEALPPDAELARALGDAMVNSHDDAFEKRGETWLRRAMELGSTQAVFQLACELDHGFTLKARPKEARKLLEKAAALDYPNALHLLGVSLLDEKQRPRGLELLNRAAELGFAWSQKRLGDEASENKDFATALAWYRKSADGDPDACAELALMYRDGLGVAASVATAKEWHDRAMRDGFDWDEDDRWTAKPKKKKR